MFTSETEHKEFKKSLAELKQGIVSLVADLLRRLHLVEAWGRGVPLILKNAPDVSFKELGSVFIASFKREYALKVTDPATDPVMRLLNELKNNDLAPGVLQQRLGLKHRATFRANYLYPALEAGLIEMTIPEKANSRLQKYRLTALGKQRVAR